MKKLTRRKARELAFVLLFEKSFNEENTIEDILENAQETREIVTDEFSLALAKGAEDHLVQIDELINSHSHKWKMNRISRVSLAILRVAIYEMNFYHDSGAGVAINEAVELSKKYGGEEDSAFINGVLGGIARQAGLSDDVIAAEAESGEPSSETEADLSGES